MSDRTDQLTPEARAAQAKMLRETFAAEAKFREEEGLRRAEHNPHELAPRGGQPKNRPKAHRGQLSKAIAKRRKARRDEKANR